MRQVNYNLALVVDPSSPSRIFQGVVNVWSYTLPNGPWIKWNGPNDNTPNSQGGLNIHSDIHALLFDPNNANLLYSGNDGGVYRFDLSGNPAVASTNWTPLNNQLVISQFRTLGFNPNWPGDMAGGLQDNATPRRLLTGRTWFGVPGNAGDGYWSQYDADFRFFNFGGLLVPSPLASTIYVNTNVPDDFDRYAPSISAGTPILGRVNEFWTDPFRPSVMLATTPISGTDSLAGALYYATNVETSTSPNWTCIDPTPTNSTDNVSAVAFARIFPSGSGGVYYVGTGNGRIYVVDVLPGTLMYCGSGTSALRNFPPTPIYTGAMAIDGLAEDPNQPCVLYALSTSAAGANRVLRLAATPTAGGCTAWSAAQAIGGGLNTTVYGQPAPLHRWTMAVDPTSSNRIYVGSAAGLFVGDLSGMTWGWTRTLDIPDTTIVDVKAPVNAAGPHGTLFAATFGRGVYERVQVSPSALSQANVKPAALSNEIRRCQLREVEDPLLRWRVAEVEVEYAYNGDQGDNVWVRPVPTAQGQTSPYFVREIQQVISGTHATNLQVLYEAADAPPGVTTDGLRVEMFPQGGGSFLSHECHASKTWRRDDARVLEVRAEDLVEEGGTGTALVPIQISLSNGAVETRQTPFSVAITQGLGITLEAPRVRTEHDELRVVHVWRKLGHDEISTSPSFTFTLNDDSTAVVSYIMLEARIFLPNVLR